MRRFSQGLLAAVCCALLGCHGATPTDPRGGDTSGGPATHFLLLASPSVPTGSPFSVVIVAANGQGKAVTTYTGSLALHCSDPNATFPSTVAFTAADKGQHTVRGSMRSPGPQSLSVTDAAGLTGSSSGWSVDGVRLLADHSSGRQLCALLTSGGTRCWGDNASGQLGLGDSMNRGSSLTQLSAHLPGPDLGTGRTGVALSLGVDHACALLDNGALKCWGDNSYGQLGLGDFLSRGNAPNTMGDALPAALLGTGRTVVGVSAGAEDTCALLDTGAIKCIGNNDDGELGVGDSLSRGGVDTSVGDALPAVSLGTGRTGLQVSFGGLHVCAVLDTHQVKCWGSNSSGQLGLGDSQSRGTAPAELGNNLPAVSLGTGRTATSIQGGDAHTCVLLDNGQVKCWGNNGAGQLGTGDTLNRGDTPGQMGDTLPGVQLGTGRSATTLAVGPAHVCVTLDDGGTKCWGDNTTGALGTGDTVSRGGQAQQMGDALGPTDLGTADSGPATKLALGVGFSCARLANAQVKCWGVNDSGQLGVGDTKPRGAASGTLGTALPAAQLW